MKKVLMVLGVVFLVLLVGVVGMIFWAQRSGSATQEVFFKAVELGDAKQVTALFHPALLEQVDEPVLAAWMASVKSELGNYIGLSKTDFSTNMKYEDGAKIVESKGTVNFEKGTAKSEITLRDDRIVAWNVVSDRIAPDWFRGPTSTELYQQKGREFLQKALTGDVQAAFDMEHESLQEALPLEKFTRALETVGRSGGGLKAIQYESSTLSGESPRLTMRLMYKVEFEKGTVPASIDFQFVGLKGHMTAFAVPAE
jgi:flagellar basal body-associated protein FliL